MSLTRTSSFASSLNSLISQLFNDILNIGILLVSGSQGYHFYQYIEASLHTHEKVLDLPDSPIGYSWLYLAQIEYRFGHGTTVFQHALQITDREEYPNLNFSISFLEAKYEFKNKTFDNLPQRIYQLAPVYSSMKKHHQNSRGAGEKGTYSISNSDLSDFASVENITIFLYLPFLHNCQQTEICTKCCLYGVQIP